MTTPPPEMRSARRPRLRMSLLRQLRDDWLANDRSLTRAGFHAVAVHRIGAWQATLPRGPGMLAWILYGLLYWFVRNVYGIEIPRNAKVGRRLRIPHQGGIVVNGDVEIGDDCLIEHNVTIGADAATGAVPRIGNRVEIGAGATIIGPVNIGDGARIGANALALTDVPPGSTAAAPPARIIAPTGGGPGSSPAQGAEPRPPLDLIRETLPITFPLDERTPLLSSGLIDSFQLVVLINALEKEYGVTLATEEVDAANFDTAEQIGAAIDRARR